MRAGAQGSRLTAARDGAGIPAALPRLMCWGWERDVKPDGSGECLYPPVLSLFRNCRVRAGTISKRSPTIP